MIRLTHLNNKEFILNCDLIQFVESTPDTLVIMTTGDKIMVMESPEELIQRVIHYKQEIIGGLGTAHLHIVKHQQPESPGMLSPEE